METIKTSNQPAQGAAIAPTCPLDIHTGCLESNCICKKGGQSRCYVNWRITGTFHGSYIHAATEGEARKIFHDRYNGESIIHVVRMFDGKILQHAHTDEVENWRIDVSINAYRKKGGQQ